MGFFSFSPNSYYVGIWYSSLPSNQSIIWTANRNQNVTLNSSLHFTANGKLQLITSNSSVIWSATDLTSNDVVNHASQAELLDTGNFVLRDNTSNVIWQSFDHPTDTLLPDQNFTFSDNPSLVPWISTTDPSPSTTYSFVFALTGGLEGTIRLLYQGSDQYWSVPSSAIVSPTFRLYSNGTAILHDSDGESRWSTNNDGSCSIPPNSITKVQLGVDGNLRVLTWSNASSKWETEWRALYLQCDVYGTCGDNAICDRDKNNSTVGGGACPAVEPTTDSICSCPSGFTRVDGSCNPRSAINCSKSMTTMDHTEFGVPDTTSNYQNLSQQSCISHCLDDCNCTVATYQNSTSDCWVQQGSLFNGVTYSQYMKTSFIKTVASNSSAANTSSSTSTFPVYAIILIVAGFLIVALFFAGFLIRSHYSSRFPNFKEVVLPDMTDRLGGPRRFTFEDLYMVTRGFHEENKLGSGGFGSVYRGTFTAPTSPHGTLDVAIKRLDQRQSSSDVKALDEEDNDFMVEIETLASIRHVNVVNLMGFCAQGPERLLVYEFVANGSLNNHLFSESSSLDWDTRFQITVGAATGIEYLHTHCPKKIVHRDIKPANILIDEEFKAKVADFGISEIMGPEREHLTNYNPRGTPSYMAPECWQVGALVTEKADAYSFGVLLLEIVSGKRVKKQQYNEDDDGGDQGKRRRGGLYFQHALGFMEVRNYEGLVDERLEGVYDKQDAERLVKVAFWCLQGHPDQRPSMEDLLLMIKGHKQVDPPPLSGLFQFPLDSGSNSSSLTTINIAEQVSAGR